MAARCAIGVISSLDYDSCFLNQLMLLKSIPQQGTTKWIKFACERLKCGCFSMPCKTRIKHESSRAASFLCDWWFRALACAGHVLWLSLYPPMYSYYSFILANNTSRPVSIWNIRCTILCIDVLRCNIHTIKHNMHILIFATWIISHYVPTMISWLFSAIITHH